MRNSVRDREVVLSKAGEAFEWTHRGKKMSPTCSCVVDKAEDKAQDKAGSGELLHVEPLPRKQTASS